MPAAAFEVLERNAAAGLAIRDEGTSQDFQPSLLEKRQRVPEALQSGACILYSMTIHVIENYRSFLMSASAVNS